MARSQATSGLLFLRICEACTQLEDLLFGSFASVALALQFDDNTDDRKDVEDLTEDAPALRKLLRKLPLELCRARDSRAQADAQLLE
eukprot:CAMPEP_0195071578 /NCGR_PEP_ID=MMETSP0448-20130528/15359_1 /TAXON_ID=66468 /ORGANISM="Heterocapsa triquestra, Strain CCMP 448" /LENGTH=86 /DNA_ID=CAMNT_0040103455 /DNA_START=201 /DNA_END=462 /DNA_ORIENTATION=-